MAEAAGHCVEGHAGDEEAGGGEVAPVVQPDR
jgi:hypothetical protein